jgi:hypothetical protein
MAMALSALRAGHHLPPGRFLVLISVRGLVDPKVIARLGGLGQMKNPTTSSGIERHLKIAVVHEKIKKTNKDKNILNIIFKLLLFRKL